MDNQLVNQEKKETKKKKRKRNKEHTPCGRARVILKSEDGKNPLTTYQLCVIMKISKFIYNEGEQL